MNALEQEIIDKFHQLDAAAQQRVRAQIAAASQPDRVAFDFDTWAAEVEAIREQIHARRQARSHDGVDVVGILRDIRDGEDE